MYCPSCKSPNPIYRKFCLSCHISLNGNGAFEPGFSHEGPLIPQSPKEAEKARAKKKWMLDKIENREDALKFSRDAAVAFFVVAALQAVLSPVVGWSVLMDSSVYALSAFFVLRFHSRIAALALLSLTCLATCLTVANIIRSNVVASGSAVISLITLVIAIRAVEASFKLHGRFALTNSSESDSTA